MLTKEERQAILEAPDLMINMGVEPGDIFLAWKRKR